jgi:hypothetical protein
MCVSLDGSNLAGVNRSSLEQNVPNPVGFCLELEMDFGTKS